MNVKRRENEPGCTEGKEYRDLSEKEKVDLYAKRLQYQVPKLVRREVMIEQEDLVRHISRMTLWNGHDPGCKAFIKRLEEEPERWKISEEGAEDPKPEAHPLDTN